MYSGNREPNLTGGVDATPEAVQGPGGVETQTWSVMLAGFAPDSAAFTDTKSATPVLLFSIEELSESDTEQVPSVEE